MCLNQPIGFRYLSISFPPSFSGHSLSRAARRWRFGVWRDQRERCVRREPDRREVRRGQGPDTNSFIENVLVPDCFNKLCRRGRGADARHAHVPSVWPAPYDTSMRAAETRCERCAGTASSVVAELFVSLRASAWARPSPRSHWYRKH